MNTMCPATNNPTTRRKMCYTEYSVFKCGHGTVLEIACPQALQTNKAGCAELPSDNMGDETRVKALCNICLQDQSRRMQGEALVEVEKPMLLPEDPNCGNPRMKPDFVGCVQQ